MKKLSIVLSFLMIVAFCFVSCDNETSAPPTEYKVTFDPDNGDEKTVVTVKEGEAVAKPEKDPVKENTVAFVSWVKDDGTAYNFEDKVTSDLTLKAAYRTKAVVTFKNGEKSETTEVEYGEKVGKPNVEVSKTVGGFANWRDEKNAIYDFDTPVTSDITLTASVWEEITSEDSVFDKGVAAMSLATAVDGLFRGKSGGQGGSLPSKDTAKTKTEIKDDLKEILVYSLGKAKMSDDYGCVGYYTYNGTNYFYSSTDDSKDVKYLYCKLIEDGSNGNEDKVVAYDANEKTITVTNLKISAKLSEGVMDGNAISKKTDNPAFEDVPVSVVINGVEKTGENSFSEFTCYLDNDTKNLIYVAYISTGLLFSDISGDYIWTDTSSAQ